MKILIVEDDNIKASLLEGFVSEYVHDGDITRASSYQSGIAKLVEKEFDLVFLDMTLPVSDLELSPVGMEWLTFAGELILRECKRRALRARVIVISQYNTFVRENEEVSFEQLKNELMSQNASLVAGCVRLDRASDNWKQEVLEIMEL